MTSWHSEGNIYNNLITMLSKHGGWGCQVLSKHQQILAAGPGIMVTIVQLGALHALVSPLGVRHAALHDLPQEGPLRVEGESRVLLQWHPCRRFELILLRY